MGEKYDPIINLDEFTETYEGLLKVMFPEMPKKFIEANKIFTELLNQYNGKTFAGIPDFLEKRGMKCEAIKFSPENCECQFSEKQKIDITSGKLKIGQKIFYGKETESPLIYYILAKKDNKMTPESVRNKILDWFGGTMSHESE